MRPSRGLINRGFAEFFDVKRRARKSTEYNDTDENKRFAKNNRFIWVFILALFVLMSIISSFF